MAGQLFEGAARWLDIFMAYDRVVSDHPRAHLPLTLAALCVWVVVPGVVGVALSLRREVA